MPNAHDILRRMWGTELTVYFVEIRRDGKRNALLYFKDDYNTTSYVVARVGNVAKSASVKNITTKPGYYSMYLVGYMMDHLLPKLLDECGSVSPTRADDLPPQSPDAIHAIWDKALNDGYGTLSRQWYC
ncbi:hypothetical protein O9K51_09116 [Purpureocillium lavendulum]|uniref:Uncharacterized protein n=1 Tax=Purpureocillium lavendulum TaxID=1247861 RepID=A0AB34FGD8_9HYPO|nr:hypothetical protein O9K51_09116 [Purpureocillium lavendulum]